MANELGKALRKARMRAGLRVEAPALEVGVSSATIYKWEAGDAAPRKGDVLLMADVYDLDPDPLLELLERVETSRAQTNGKGRYLLSKTSRGDFRRSVRRNVVSLDADSKAS